MSCAYCAYPLGKFCPLGQAGRLGSERTVTEDGAAYHESCSKFLERLRR